MMHHRDAVLIIHDKTPLSDGSIMEVIIWELPEPSSDRPHGYKYRLNYCQAHGTTLVRYDNKSGKGDHKHLRNLEVPYEFTTIEKLFSDFLRDIVKMGERQ